uniref:RING-type E3 ubiquitin transferase n=1 Tax=Scleropages formosus TaxID=113540 RepID=A0A8C9RH20_SCLFO
MFMLYTWMQVAAGDFECFLYFFYRYCTAVLRWSSILRHQRGALPDLSVLARHAGPLESRRGSEGPEPVLSTVPRPLLQDYTCPRCESGFIEELPQEGSTESGSAPTSRAAAASGAEPERRPFENAERQLFAFPSAYGQFAVGIFDESFDLGAGSLPAEEEEEPEAQAQGGQESPSARQSGSRQLRRGPTRRPEGVPTLEGGVLHSSPMDYVWGANGLDAIITQLLNQFENSGPPPADRDKIKSLPTVQVTEEHVGSGLECPVCKEDYSVGESVRQLPCSHLFHNDCIVPWLEQHDTCPVCRKSLSGQNTATNPPDVSGMNFSHSSSSSSSSPCTPSTSPSDENVDNNS